MKTLPEDIAKKIDELSEQGNSFLDEKDDFESAIKVWKQALELLPEPREEWEACDWLYASIGEAYFLAEKDQESFLYFSKAFELDQSNPFVLFRLGVLHADRHEDEKAADLLTQVYDKVGDEIFEGYENYLSLVKSRPQTLH